MSPNTRLRSVATVLVAGAVACSGSGPTDPGDQGGGEPLEPHTDTTALATGTLSLPAADAFDAPGFHEPFEVSGTLPSELGGTTGFTLVLELRDASRPAQTCSSDSPAGGCATIDWDDFPSRPKTPESGIFLNRLQVVAGARTRDFHLRKSFELSEEPQPGPPT